MHIARILEASADRYPDHTALVYEDRRWTYREWLSRVRRFAQALSDLGVRPGDRVAFYVSTSENSVTTFFACQFLGAVAVPMNFRLSPGEAAYILRDSGARVLVYGRALTDSTLRIAEEVHSVHDFIGCAYDCSNIPPGHHHFDTLVEQSPDQGEPRPVPARDAISSLVYTSGTTGRPKGVIHTHANDIAIAMNCVMEYSLRHDDRALHIAPLYHVGGMQAYFIPHLLVGGTNVVIGRYDAERTLLTIAAERITTLFAVPTQIQEMLFHPDFARFDVSSLRLVTTGGAAISSATMERVTAEFCSSIFNGYGMTEASLTLVLHPEDALRKLGSCGKPTLISECRIIIDNLDREVSPDERVSQGEIGQLIVRGPQGMSGYWNKPSETQKKLKAGWIYTGDLFSQDEDGFYYFHGRADDMIVSGGENIYPREVEEILYRCPGVKEVSVVGLSDARWGQIVVAFVVRSDPDLRPETIDAHVRASRDLASYKRPKRYEFLETLPINPSGKVLKRELIARYEKASPKQAASCPTPTSRC
ncbi:long-chain fatty acid--CoA ligase (plasmid) [Mesorhizobium mediterraneum]|uniref:AMP-dependent synthetase n=1 Tax=Mesorhizobium mediterraneum TaxID=43617 RepID=A0AB36QZN6_9HYPH|nr:long-chain fatty acid--CoA ligase [Mesorhizobium mediterraneum]PAP97588.1 AMP-dependent synthetase [Mesorhizobium mediterraneum]RWN26239.1 MAG: long-chain-fatty-acid--CoA ligase [Mesorhizobium sp.]WIW57070.1 long-chain fatty acid--CoA ligase [Mesorhizobium mediterraneum]